MSPFLETWYHQKDCEHCGAQLCFIDGVPTESDGTDHRAVCKRTGNSHRQRFQAPVLPEKPSNPRRAVEYEKAHEGQKTLEDWCQ